jgi:hypothetical protein
MILEGHEVEDKTHILGFYTGTRPDDRGRFLREILRWPDYKLEQTHDYIQWLFPLAERSALNPEAPILDAKTIREFRSRLELLRNVQTVSPANASLLRDGDP